MRRKRFANQDLFRNIPDRAGETLRIPQKFLTIKQLQLKLIAWRRESLLTTQVNPVEQRFLRLGDPVFVITSCPAFGSPIEVSRDLSISDVH